MNEPNKGEYEITNFGVGDLKWDNCIMFHDGHCPRDLKIENQDAFAFYADGGFFGVCAKISSLPKDWKEKVPELYPIEESEFLEFVDPEMMEEISIPTNVNGSHVLFMDINSEYIVFDPIPEFYEGRRIFVDPDPKRNRVNRSMDEGLISKINQMLES